MAGPTADDMKDIQGFVISGYAHLPCVSYLLLRVNDPVAARGWLAQVLKEVTTSEGKELISCLNIAISHHGLMRLGLDAETRDTFSRPFIEGMATPHRSRILGDADKNAPGNWDWGGDIEADETKAVDILLLLFGKDETTLDSLINAACDERDDANNREVELLARHFPHLEPAMLAVWAHIQRTDHDPCAGCEPAPVAEAAS